MLPRGSSIHEAVVAAAGNALLVELFATTRSRMLWSAHGLTPCRRFLVRPPVPSRATMTDARSDVVPPRPAFRPVAVLLLRVRLPNQPGALGAVASALGAIGADINLLEIVEKRGTVEVDDFILDLPHDRSVTELVTACDALPGVEVEWVRNYPRGGGIDLDVELHRRMVADGERAPETLMAAAPLVFRARWSLLMDVSGTPRVTARSPGAPDLDPEVARRFAPFDTLHRVALEQDWLPGWEPHHAVVAPLSDRQVLVVGRPGEPPFFASELARLGHLVGTPGTAEEPAEAPAAPGAGGHRTPVAPPLYLRPGGAGPGSG